MIPTIETATEILKSHVEPHLSSDGFCYRKSSKRFIRKGPNLIQMFGLGFSRGAGVLFLKTLISVSVPAVNKLANEILSEKRPTTDWTYAFSIANETDRKRGSYSIYTADDVSASAPGVLAEYREIATPLFASLNTIKDLDGYLNDLDSLQSRAMMSPRLAGHGLLVASLADNPSLRALAQKYMDFWASGRPAAVSAPLTKVVEHLLSTQLLRRC